MQNLSLIDIYYRPNHDVPEYMDVLLVTDKGTFKQHACSLDKSVTEDFETYKRLNEIDDLRSKHGELIIEEVRVTYDNDMYLLISGIFLFVIEYVLSTYTEHSIQQFRIIEDLHNSNKEKIEEFYSLDVAELH